MQNFTDGPGKQDWERLGRSAYDIHLLMQGIPSVDELTAQLASLTDYERYFLPS